MQPFLIGITGGSGSGKTLFLNSLLKEFKKDQICVISQDNYYLPRDQQPVDANGFKNFDTPESINAEEFAIDIAKIKSGLGFEREEYTFNNPEAKPGWLTFQPAPIVVVEGLFVMHYTPVSELLDLRIFIEAKGHVKLKRRIVRDKVERGYDLSDVLYRFENHVMPAYDQFVGPLRHDADLIIPNNSTFNNALKVLIGFIRYQSGIKD